MLYTTAYHIHIHVCIDNRRDFSLQMGLKAVLYYIWWWWCVQCGVYGVWIIYFSRTFCKYLSFHYSLLVSLPPSQSRTRTYILLSLRISLSSTRTFGAAIYNGKQNWVPIHTYIHTTHYVTQQNSIHKQKKNNNGKHSNGRQFVVMRVFVVLVFAIATAAAVMLSLSSP